MFPSKDMTQRYASGCAGSLGREALHGGALDRASVNGSGSAGPRRDFKWR